MIGNKLKKIRKINNMTLKEVEAVTGISNGNLSSYENEKKLPGTLAIIELCKAYNISADWLLLDKPNFSFTEEDKNFLNKYNHLSDREKGRIDEIIDSILQNKIEKKETL